MKHGRLVILFSWDAPSVVEVSVITLHNLSTGTIFIYFLHTDEQRSMPFVKFRRHVGCVPHFELGEETPCEYFEVINGEGRKARRRKFK